MPRCSNLIQEVTKQRNNAMHWEKGWPVKKQLYRKNKTNRTPNNSHQATLLLLPLQIPLGLGSRRNGGTWASQFNRELVRPASLQGNVLCSAQK